MRKLKINWKEAEELVKKRRRLLTELLASDFFEEIKLWSSEPKIEDLVESNANQCIPYFGGEQACKREGYYLDVGDKMIIPFNRKIQEQTRSNGEVILRFRKYKDDDKKREIEDVDYDNVEERKRIVNKCMREHFTSKGDILRAIKAFFTNAFLPEELNELLETKHLEFVPVQDAYGAKLMLWDGRDTFYRS